MVIATMLRTASVFVMLLLTVACSEDGQGRAAITDRCVAGGERPEVCQCFADESSRRLDRAMFQLVVHGAQGDDIEAEALMRKIGPERQREFATVVRGIIRGCGAEGYLAAS